MDGNPDTCARGSTQFAGKQGRPRAMAMRGTIGRFCANIDSRRPSSKETGNGAGLRHRDDLYHCDAGINCAVDRDSLGHRLGFEPAHGADIAAIFDEFTVKASNYAWCPGPESNRHALRRGILSPLRLPISPPGPERGANAPRQKDGYCKVFRKFCFDVCISPWLVSLERHSPDPHPLVKI